MADTPAPLGSLTWSPDAGAVSFTPRDRDRAAQAADKAAGDAAMAKLVREYRETPGFRVDQLRAKLAACTDFTPERDRAALQASLAVAEAELTTSVQEAFSEQSRVENALAGKVDHPGIEVTTDGQIPSRDFTAAIQSDVELGIRSEMIKSFYATGKSTDPMGHKAAEIWIAAYKSDPEMQRLHVAGDRVITRQFKLAHMYLAGAHGTATPEQERAYLEALGY
jgi:hypothetical protein